MVSRAQPRHGGRCEGLCLAHTTRFDGIRQDGCGLASRCQRFLPVVIGSALRFRSRTAVIHPSPQKVPSRFVRLPVGCPQSKS